MTRSWWKKVIILLTAILLTVGMFLAWTSYNYSNQVRKTIQEENSRSLQMWVSSLKSRTDTVYEHIFELLITLYNNTELRADTPIMSVRAKDKIIEMMEDKLLVSSDADAFFVFDTENDYYLFGATDGLPTMQVLDMKRFCYDNAISRAHLFGDKTWELTQIGNTLYFFKCVQLGKYIVGAISDCAYYKIEDSVSVLGKDPVCLLLTGDAAYSFGNTTGLDSDRRIPEAGWVTTQVQADFLNGFAVLSVRPESLTGEFDWVPALLLVDSALCIVLVVVLLLVLRREVAIPTKKLIQANYTLASGQMDYRLDADSAENEEFLALYDSFNNMAERIVQLHIEAYDAKLQEEQNKLTMIRAQVKPHMFLNAVTTISNMTFMNKPEEIRDYIANFAKFMRYMLKLSSPWTTVGEELDHIRIYLQMQQIRFPGSIRSQIRCEEGVQGEKIPFLVLFTLVENSIKHAMTLYETMDIRILCQRIETETFSGIRLVEEDNGEGFPEELIPELLYPDPNSLFAKEHLGLSNVRYTLNLIYRRSDLLHIHNLKNGGAHVEIWIPDGEETV